MASSAIKTPAFQAKAGSIQNQADTSAVYSDGEWSFKNSSAVASVTIKDDGAVTLGPSGFTGNHVVNGNVGIGTASPTRKLHINGAVNVSDGNSDRFVMSFGSASGVTLNNNDNSPMIFATANTERMRIDSSGNVGIGTASPIGTLTVGSNDTNAVITSGGGNTHLTLAAVGSAGALIFGAGGVANGVKGTERMRIDASGYKQFSNGSIFILSNAISPGAGSFPVKWNSSTGVLTYDSSSRLVKDQIENIPYGLNSVLSLQPRKYFRTDDQKEEIGFIADEVQSIIPEVVPMVEKSIFTKDEEDTELIPGGVNYEKLTAVLCKAIQEQQAQIEEMKAKIAALEAK